MSGVVHVVTGLEVGGAEMLLFELCREEARRGQEFSVVSLISDGPMRKRLAQIGIDVFGLDMKRGRFPSPRIARLARFLRRTRPRIVQGWLYHGNLAASAAGWLSGSRPRPRVVWGIFGALPEFTCYPPRLRRTVRVSKILSPSVDGILYNSRVALEAHQLYGFRSLHSQVVSNGIDLTSFRSGIHSRAATRCALGLPNDAIVVIAVGRLDPMKNWAGMLAATAAATERNVWLLAVGEGTERLPPAARRLLLGRRDDMPALYAAADIFLLASHFGEGTSVALTEAMACGLPVIVTDVGDNGGIAGDAGLVVAPRDPDSLNRAVKQLTGDAAFRARAGKIAQARADRFGVDQLYAGFHDFYDRLLAGPARTRAG